MANKINLPRKEKDGTQYISISQFTSFNSDLYKNQYILGYLFGIRDEGNAFSWFGSQVGEFLETSGEKVGELLDENDIKILNEVVERLKPLSDKEFEKEIRLEREGFFIKGYIDLYYKTDGKANVVDFKTLNLKKKEAFYANNDPTTKEPYMQTLLYSRALEIDGEEIAHCGVFGLDRTFAGTFQEPILHLSGETKVIPTPYNKSNTEKFLKDVDKTVYEISSLQSTYDVLKDLEIEF